MKLKVLTLNSYLFPSFAVQNEWDDYREHRADAIINLIDEYDLVFLQEVVDTVFSREWKRKLMSIPGFYIQECQAASSADVRLLSSGIYILSRYPIVQSVSYPFEAASGYGFNTYWGYLIATIDVESIAVDCVCVHLQPTVYDMKEDVASLYRYFQIREIKRRLRPDYAWIIGGDFNCNDIPPSEFGAFDRSVDTVGTYNTLAPFSIPIAPQDDIAYDHIITNQHMLSSQRLTRMVSDHYPVEAVIELVG